MPDIRSLRAKIGMFRGGQAPRETKQIAEYMLELCDHIDSLVLPPLKLESPPGWVSIT